MRVLLYSMRERGVVDQLNAKLAELRGRLDGVERKLRGEEERAARHDKAIQQANATFEKLLDSTATLAEFVKKEYQDAKREAGGEH